jgi:ABC-type phosphate transport system substrate-binding protein
VSAQRACWIAILIAGSCVFSEAKDLALVSYKANTVTTLTIADLAKVCKGQTNRWPDGKPVTCVIRNPNSSDVKLLLDKLYGISKDELLAAIAAANHGRANHPAVIVVESDEDLVKRVESTPGAVGLVDVYAITGGVTVLKVGGKFPLEPGYPLHGN